MTTGGNNNISELLSTSSSISSGDDEEFADDDHGEYGSKAIISRKFSIRLFASNLVMKGRTSMFSGMSLPDTFCVVSSTAPSSDTTEEEKTDTRRSSTKNSVCRNNENESTTDSASFYHHHRGSAFISTNNSSSTSLGSSSNNIVWGQTEVVYKSRHPQWTTAINIDYVTGTQIFFYVHLFQHNPGNKATHLYSFGTALFYIPDILSMKNLTRVKRLRRGGCIFCRLEPIIDTNNLSRTIRLHIQANDLLIPKRTVFRKQPDTVLEICKRIHSDRSWMVVHRSEPVKHSSNNPLYDPIQLDLETLCGSDIDRHLRFLIWAVQSNRRNKRRTLVGLCETTVRNLLQHREHALDDDDDDSNSSASTTMLVEDEEIICNTTTTTQSNRNNKRGEKPKVELLLQRNSNRYKQVGRLIVLKVRLRSDDGVSPYKLPNNNNTANNNTANNNSQQSVIDVVDLTKLHPLSPPKQQIINYTTIKPLSPMKSFTYYIQQGCQIDFCVAIDYTSSNGDPMTENSCHCLVGSSLNDYEETIVTLGTALEQCNNNNSKEYVVWGFGAKFDGIVRHIFQCGDTPTVHGVDGILNAYRSVFQSDLIMSGPTNFISILQAAAARSKRNHDTMIQQQQQLKYTVLLIITDGCMNNFNETKQRIQLYSTMPLSIIFVGVGRSDFRIMYELCRTSPNNDNNNKYRCNTTFVEFRRNQHDPAALGNAALRNIPQQLCEYMQLQGI